MPDLVKPELSELSYRKRLLGSSRTMSWLRKTIPFEKKDQEDFYRTKVEADPHEGMYRLIYCPGCNDFVGEVAYERNLQKDRYDLTILIESSRRLCGYGKWAVQAIRSIAKGYGINELYTAITSDNPASAFLEKQGFAKIAENDREILYRLTSEK